MFTHYLQAETDRRQRLQDQTAEREQRALDQAAEQTAATAKNRTEIEELVTAAHEVGRVLTQKGVPPEVLIHRGRYRYFLFPEATGEPLAVGWPLRQLVEWPHKAYTNYGGEYEDNTYVPKQNKARLEQIIVATTGELIHCQGRPIEDRLYSLSLRGMYVGQIALLRPEIVVADADTIEQAGDYGASNLITYPRSDLMTKIAGLACSYGVTAEDLAAVR